MISELALILLNACHSVSTIQQKLVSKLAQSLGIPPNRLFYSWMKREIKQDGIFGENDWKYFFHGLECDIENVHDQRFLRVDFGPHGRLDTFSDWGVLQFIMASKAPWPTFQQLQKHLANQDPPFNAYSGSKKKIFPIWNELYKNGMLQVTDPELVSFVESHTHYNEKGGSIITLPKNTSLERQLDSLICHRITISEKGMLALKTHPLK